MRFNRTGKKNRVSYRIVLQEHAAAPGKRHVEILGSYDPHSKNATLKKERIEHWLKEGVQTSDAVYNLLVGQGIIEGEKRAKKMPKAVTKEEPVAEVANKEEEPTEQKESVEEVKESMPEEAAPETDAEPTESEKAEEKETGEEGSAETPETSENSEEPVAEEGPKEN